MKTASTKPLGIHILGTAIAAASVFATSAALAVGALPSNVRAAIAKTYPGYQVVKKGMHDSECYDLPNLPRDFVRTDLNGDGQDDYVVQLIGPKHLSKAGPWNEYDTVFLLFLAKADGSYLLTELWSVGGPKKSNWFAVVDTPGEVLSENRDQFITTKFPRLYLIRCQSGYGVFYWDGKEMRAVGGS